MNGDTGKIANYAKFSLFCYFASAPFCFYWFFSCHAESEKRNFPNNELCSLFMIFMLEKSLLRNIVPSIIAPYKPISAVYLNLAPEYL